MSMKAFVTGADGFIGSHLCEQLLRAGYDVKALCLYNSFGSCGWLNSLDSKVKSQIDICFGDIRDLCFLRSAMAGSSHIFHLASLISIPYSYIATSSYVSTNVTGTMNVLEVAKDLGVAKLIHTSTSETYGSAQFVPITEEHPLNAQSPYAATKIAADQLALSYWRSFELPVAVLRPFNTYGPRQSTRAVIPAVITQILSGQKTIKLGSLTPTRDFNFVTDTCNAFIAVAQADVPSGVVLNACSNFEISIRETVDIICDLMHADIEIQTAHERLRPVNSEVNRLYGDNSKIVEVANWSPMYAGRSGLRNGLEKTINWFSDPLNLSYYNMSDLLL